MAGAKRGGGGGRRKVRSHVASKHGLDDECQVIHEFSVVKCCLSYLNIFEFKRDSYPFGDMSQEVSCLS